MTLYKDVPPPGPMIYQKFLKPLGKRIAVLISPIFETIWLFNFRLAGLLLSPNAYPWSSSGQQRALILAPHPDDEIVGCLSAILKHQRKNDQICVVYVTDGRLSRILGEDSPHIVEIRKQEAKTSCQHFNITNWHWLGLPEGNWQTDDLKAWLISFIEAEQPEIIYAPSCIDFHPDHYQVALALTAALAERKDGWANVKIRIYAVQVPLTPLLSNLTIDLPNAEANQTATLDCYPSQARSIVRTFRQRRYNAALYCSNSPIDEYWECSPAQYQQLHQSATFSQVSGTVFPMRLYPFRDPLSYIRGWSTRRLLAQFKDDG